MAKKPALALFDPNLKKKGSNTKIEAENKKKKNKKENKPGLNELMKFRGVHRFVPCVCVC